MRFYLLWYEHVILGLATCAVLYYVKYFIFDGEDILLSIIALFRRKK